MAMTKEEIKNEILKLAKFGPGVICACPVKFGVYGSLQAVTYVSEAKRCKEEKSPMCILGDGLDFVFGDSQRLITETAYMAEFVKKSEQMSTYEVVIYF